MTLEQLRIFVAVAERQHMTGAAQALNLSQSAASTAIANLETQYRVKLFDRIGRGIALTEAGTIFLSEAKAVLARAAAAEQSLNELGGMTRGTLRVQASQTIGSYWLPSRLVTFHERYPGIALELAIGNSAQVAAAVVDGAADLGFVEGEIDDEKLSREKVATDRLVLVAAPRTPLALRRRVDIADLERVAWVLREVGSGTRTNFELAMAALGIDVARLNVALVLPSNEAVRAAVEAGLGATVLSASVVAPAIEAGLLRVVKRDLPERAFYAVSHRERFLPQSARALLEAVLPRPA